MSNKRSRDEDQGPPISDSERRFVAEYLVDGNGTRAYLAVHPHCKYGSARVQASRLLTKPNIRREIRAGREAAIRRARVSQDEALQEILRVAFSDPVYLVDQDDQLLPVRKVPLETRRALAALDVYSERTTTKVTRSGKTTTQVETASRVVKCRFHDKLKALSLLCRYLGLHTGTLPPIEVLLGMLPKKVADELREALRSKVENGPEGTGQDGWSAGP